LASVATGVTVAIAEIVVTAAIAHRAKLLDLNFDLTDRVNNQAL
jgi:hypothetical protein